MGMKPLNFGLVRTTDRHTTVLTNLRGERLRRRLVDYGYAIKVLRKCEVEMEIGVI
jgi:hypothetical protein